MGRAGALITAVLVAALMPVGSGHAATTQQSIFQDDDLLIHVSPAETDPNAYDPADLQHLDSAVRSAAAHGIGVLLNVRGGVPAWAMHHPIPGKFAERDTYRPDPARFGRFVQMLGRRYSGQFGDLPRVDTWSVWNEPNWSGHLSPQSLRDRRTHRLYTVAPVLYRQLFRAATAALAATGHGADTILLGETAPIGNTKLGELSHLKPVRFLLDLFCLDGRLKPLTGLRAKLEQCDDFAKAGPLAATGYAHHPYSVTDPPAQPSTDPGFIRLADGVRLERILDAAGRQGRTRRGLPVWYTEYGYQTAPPDPYRGVTLAQQAAWLVAAEHLAWADPRVASTAQFLLRDDEPRTLYGAGDPRFWGTYQTGLEFNDGTPKPAYDAYRLPLYAPEGLQPGTPLELWGMVRPGVNGSAQRVRIEYREGDGSDWVAVADNVMTDGHGYFTATLGEARPGQYRFEWIKPEPDKPAAAGAMLALR
jgi:hypothetical protein